jgi:hypothetical protein
MVAPGCPYPQRKKGKAQGLKVHKIEIFFGFDFEICIISLFVMSKYYDFTKNFF